MENWKKIFKKNVHIIKFDKEKGNKIFYDFLKIIGVKEIDNFKFPFKSNTTRKIKFWNLKRLFYLMYLKKIQKILFKKKDLEIF